MGDEFFVVVMLDLLSLLGHSNMLVAIVREFLLTHVRHVWGAGDK